MSDKQMDKPKPNHALLLNKLYQFRPYDRLIGPKGRIIHEKLTTYAITSNLRVHLTSIGNYSGPDKWPPVQRYLVYFELICTATIVYL